jgi:hypothetical protein
MNPCPHPLLFLAIATLCLLAQTASAASFSSIQSGRWSDPQTWWTSAQAREANGTSRSLPGSGDDVFISTDTTVILDTSTIDIIINRVTVAARAVLTCPRNVDNVASGGSVTSLTVTTLRVESAGCFSCGYGDCTTDAEPYAGIFLLRLASDRPPAKAEEDVRTFMVANGGAVFLNGASRIRPLTRLARDTEAGETTLRVADDDILSSPQSWRIGDRVVIAPTDASPDQTEYGIIKTISADPTTPTITLADPLRYARNGKTLTLTNQADGNRRITIDARAEIALLSRNIVIEGINDAVTGLGGDFMIGGDNVRARLSWVEFRYLGRRAHLARYPLHIHNLGDSGRNVVVSNVAIHSSFQRGIVVHCTNGVNLVNNTVAGVPGFAYMLEDGAEEGNVLVNNLAIDVKPSAYPLIQTERVNPAAFWFVNAANTFVGNVAAGVAGAGFALDMDPVLASRPATLDTCPERLPGYNAKLASSPDTTGAYNQAINTALIRKEFQRFEDNVVHSAPSGLWMSYPFTPMFFVNRTVPLVRFTAWNLSRRQLPTWSLESSDGVSLQFDACMRLQGQRGMHIYGLTCVNAQTATWASCVNTFDGTTVAWTNDDAELKRQRNVAPSAAISSKSLGALLTHSEPQIFVKTQVVTTSGDSASMGTPLFASVARGGPLAPLNTLVGASIRDSGDINPQSPTINNNNNNMAKQRPLVHLNAGDMQVFTDATGEAFGAGAGAIVAATSANASGLDPLVQTYLSDRCALGTYAGDRAKRHPSSSALPSGRIVSVTGGLPMLCKASADGASRDDALRFTTISVDLRDDTWARVPLNPSIDVGRLVANDMARQTLSARSFVTAMRRLDVFPALLPLTRASMDPFVGGYAMRFAAEMWTHGIVAKTARSIEIALSPTIQPSDGLTLYISGLPAQALVAKQQSGGAVVVDVSPSQNGIASMSTCQQAMITSCRPTQPATAASSRPCLCVCHFQQARPGELLVRFYAAQTPRQVGLHTGLGLPLGIYDFPSLRVDLR